MQYDSNALLPGVGAQSENRSPAAEPYQKKNKNPALRAEKPYLAMRSFFSDAQRRGVFVSFLLPSAIPYINVSSVSSVNA